MDILSTFDWGPEEIDRRIADTEAAYKSLKAENERIRQLATRPDIAQALADENVSLDAALISSCRSDALSCGRCAFWNALRKHGFAQDALNT
jgi:hypothetical protein